MSSRRPITKWDNRSDASRPLCLGAVLPHQVQLLQLRLDVFSRSVFERYVDRVCADMKRANATVAQIGARIEPIVDSIYLGGGTPTVLEIAQLQRLFITISQNFEVHPGAEVTVECAPGTLTPLVIEALQGCSVNRVSLGVQSFVDREAAAVGRLHTRAVVQEDVARLRAAGITNINIDLIAG